MVLKAEKENSSLQEKEQIQLQQLHTDPTNYDSAVSQMAIRSGGYVADAVVAESSERLSTTTLETTQNGEGSVRSLPTTIHSSRDVDSDVLGRRSISTGSLADDERSLDDKIEIGSAHTCSSISSEDQRAYWNDAWAISRSSTSP